MLYHDTTMAFLSDLVGNALPSPRMVGRRTLITIPAAPGSDYSFGMEALDTGARVFACAIDDPEVELWDAHALDEFGSVDEFRRIVLLPVERMLRHESRISLAPRLLGVGTRLEILEGTGWSPVYGGGLVVAPPWHGIRRIARRKPVLSASALIPGSPDVGTSLE